MEKIYSFWVENNHQSHASLAAKQIGFWMWNTQKSELVARKKVQCCENISTGVVQPILLPNKQKETTRILQPGDLMPLQQKQRNIKTLTLDVFKFDR